MNLINNKYNQNNSSVKVVESEDDQPKLNLLPAYPYILESFGGYHFKVV